MKTEQIRGGVTIELSNRVELIEYNMSDMRRLLIETTDKVDSIFESMKGTSILPIQGIFFDGQIFDAYIFVSDLIRKAIRRIVLIDNYIDDTVLTLLDKRFPDVTATLYTGKLSKTVQLDISKHNSQYAPIEIKTFDKAHDRFLIIDDDVLVFSVYDFSECHNFGALRVDSLALGARRSPQNACSDNPATLGLPEHAD